MFFPKLRRHAKWMFVFLALIFGLGFVIFGVGANQGTGIGDILRNGGGAGTGDAPSVSDARARVDKNPKDATARRELATALEADGRDAEAIAALEAYSQLRPKDEDALRELAGLYLTKGTIRQQDAQDAQLRASYLTAGQVFTPPLDVGKGVTIAKDPIAEAVSTEANQAVTDAFTASQAAFTAAVDAYEKLVKLAPSDPNAQLELAQTAEQTRDYAKAIAAYQRFLKLAPDDTSAPIVKRQIKLLQDALKPAPSG
jgi:tetratricopeptide (TPR) repeat protein